MLFYIISLITLHGYIIILFVSFQGFIPKTATYRKFLWLEHVWQCFSCMLLHQAQLAPPAEFSFFLSKNVTYFFFESMITLLYQPLCCGSPMGTMNFSMCNGIWLTEFSQSFFLPINSFPLSLYKRSLESKHENAFCSACTTSSHVLDLNRMSQGYYFADGCYGRWC